MSNHTSFGLYKSLVSTPHFFDFIILFSLWLCTVLIILMFRRTQSAVNPSTLISSSNFFHSFMSRISVAMIDLSLSASYNISYFSYAPKSSNVVTTPLITLFVNVHSKKFCFSILPAEKNSCFHTFEQTGESSSSSYFSSCYSSQFKSSKKFNWFILYLKLETVLSVDLTRAWNIVHISQVLSSFCFQATWLVWTRLNTPMCAASGSNRRIMYRYGQTTWRVSDRYERLVTVAAEFLATPCWQSSL
jgi:hypothetical protein